MKCFSCGQRLTMNVWAAITEDGQEVRVGQSCAKKIIAAGEAGYQPPKGGPRLFKYESRVWMAHKGE